MSRAIEFRGLTVNGDFVYGSLVNNCVGLPNGIGQNTKTWIVTSAFGNGGWFNIRGRQYVKPETVGQFTGLHDCKGVKIYDGDIVQSYHFTDENRKDHFLSHIVKWSDKFNGWFMLNKQDLSGNDGSIQMWVYMKSSKYTAKVIGNIHQNSELLK